MLATQPAVEWYWRSVHGEPPPDQRVELDRHNRRIIKATTRSGIATGVRYSAPRSPAAIATLGGAGNGDATLHFEVDGQCRRRGHLTLAMRPGAVGLRAAVIDAVSLHGGWVHPHARTGLEGAMNARTAIVAAVVLAVSSTPAATAVDVVRCGGQVATIVGTSGADTLVGTDGADVIAGLGGDDVVRGGDGRDTICGGAGDDKLDGDRWWDRLFGGPGADRLADPSADLDGGRGDDLIVGRTLVFAKRHAAVTVDLAAGTSQSADGNDTLRGVRSVDGTGNGDTLVGDTASYAVHGRGGDDVIRIRAKDYTGLSVAAGGRGNDVLFGRGAPGSDGTLVLDGGQGDDVLMGGRTDDFLHGGPGSDYLAGGRGKDTVLYTKTGFDWNARRGLGPVRVDLSEHVAVHRGGRDILRGINSVRGSEQSDVLIGSARGDVLYAGAGDDDLRGRRGSDHLDGEGGRDTIDGGRGDDVCRGERLHACEDASKR